MWVRSSSCAGSFFSFFFFISLLVSWNVGAGVGWTDGWEEEEDMFLCILDRSLLKCGIFYIYRAKIWHFISLLSFIILSSSFPAWQFPGLAWLDIAYGGAKICPFVSGPTRDVIWCSLASGHGGSLEEECFLRAVGGI